MNQVSQGPLNIGAVAKLAGVTPKTVRHYHKIGLMAEPERTESGYRVYTAKDLLFLQHIRHMRSLGFPLKKIEALRGKPDAELLKQELEGLEKELLSQIELLQARVERIKAFREDPILEAIHRSLEVPTIDVMQRYFMEQSGPHVSHIPDKAIVKDKDLTLPVG